MGSSFEEVTTNVSQTEEWVLTCSRLLLSFMDNCVAAEGAWEVALYLPYTQVEQGPGHAALYRQSYEVFGFLELAQDQQNSLAGPEWKTGVQILRFLQEALVGLVEVRWTLWTADGQFCPATPDPRHPRSERGC